MASISSQDLGLLEVHDCFSITGLLALEAVGVCKKYMAGEFVYSGESTINGTLPTNLSGGLCGFGHPTGATGIRQLSDLQKQFCGTAENQVDLKKEYGLMISMGGNDISVSALSVSNQLFRQTYT